MFRRLDDIGKRSVILKELSCLPKTTQETYSLLFRDLMKYRSDLESDQLSYLFVWMAYYREPDEISLRSTQLLLDLLISTSDSEDSEAIIIEEELNGRSSR